jgi:hypothetical protein
MDQFHFAPVWRILTIRSICTALLDAEICFALPQDILAREIHAVRKVFLVVEDGQELVRDSEEVILILQ